MLLRSTITLLAAAAAALVAGCQSVDGAITQHGARSRSVLARVAPVAADLRARAPVARDGVALLDAPLVLDAAYPRSANAALLYYEDLSALGELGNVYARIGGTKQISECASLLEHRTFPWDPHEPQRWNEAITGFEVASKLEVCGQLRTLLVIRTMELVKPSGARVEARALPGAADAGSPGTISSPSESACRVPTVQCRFDGGQIKAEVHVFALDPFAYKGAFLFDVESGDKLKLEGAWTDATLENDLAARLGSALGAAVTRSVPGAVVKGFP